MSVTIRQLLAHELDEAEVLFRQAFSAFLKIPEKQLGDANFTRAKILSQPEGAIAAELDGKLVSVCFLQSWGSLAVIGPSIVRPTGWTGGAGMLTAKRCLEVAYDEWGCREVAALTFAQSTGHIEFMRRIDLWPRMMNAHMSRMVPPAPQGAALSLSMLDASARARCIAEARELSEQLHPGLSLEKEFHKVLGLGIGDVVLLGGGGKLEGFAVCQFGPGSEAEKRNCLVKFGMVRPGATAGSLFGQLVQAVESFVVARGLSRVSMGVNLVHQAAYRALAGRGYLPRQWHVSLHHRNAPAYQVPGDHLFVLDDWR
jgi:hypothetical protein